MNDRIRFGPAGNSRSFYDQGHKGTLEAPLWLRGQGLDAFEYSFGHGIRGKEPLWRSLAGEMAGQDIALSVHAPYYINFCSDKDEARLKSRWYLTETLRAAALLGAGRVVFHPGSASKQSREDALRRAQDELGKVLAETDTDELRSILLCPETMGKASQLGTVEEILTLCELDRARLLPTFDFGHINARGQGVLRTPADFAAVFDATEARLGADAAAQAHIHFSRIEYGMAGEIRHLTFEDNRWGPFFEPLALVLAQRRYVPVVICESAGTMAEDALAMRALYERAL